MITSKKIIKNKHKLQLYNWVFIAAWLARQVVFQRRRGGRDYAVVDTFAMLQIVIIAFCFIQLLINWGRFKPHIRHIKNSSLKFYFLFLFMCLAFSPLSPSFYYSAYMSVEIVITFLLVLFLMARYSDFYTAEKAFVFSSLFILGLSIGSALHRGVGIHTNSYSTTAAVLAIYCLAEQLTASKKRKPFLQGAFVLAMIGLILGTSTASNISFLCGFAAMLVLALFKNKSFTFLAVVSIILLISSLGITEILTQLFPGKNIEDVIAVKHRSGIWTASYNIALEKPFFGYGFGVGTKEIFSVRSAHSSILEALLATGFSGLLFFLLYHIYALIEGLASKVRNLPGSLGYFLGLLTFFINNQSAPAIGTPQSATSIGFYALVGLFVFHIKEKRIRYYKALRKRNYHNDRRAEIKQQV